ncbi:unnamed protein product [Acanthoscelides obtectus]|uniref:Uncharacterized protein n=1 Tax=Acanthoscelides obtectus TaxID=200917 RepID=A0A9P0KNZ3_ACAOB|nr:unnamed protein product [Acanthoscelides obtectus]CAK1647289.1 hypothetical protein AOBTE_LOCUS15160 [Acanthoscelides obtectus]
MSSNNSTRSSYNSAGHHSRWSHSAIGGNHTRWSNGTKSHGVDDLTTHSADHWRHGHTIPH